jgi:hypothetical protein
VFVELLFFQQRYIILDTTEGKITQKQTGQSNPQKKMEQYSSASVY